MRGALAAACALLADAAEPALMNAHGVPYAISNPSGSGTYSTNFQLNAKGPVEHFDVYGEVHSQYSQVYWTRNAPINLPPELVKRFEGKVMAITGYEIDQVVHEGPQKGSTSTEKKLGGFSCYPECEGKDTSIPTYNAYNHHYFSWLVGKNAEVYDMETPSHVPNPTSTGVRDKEGAASGFPTNIVFKENPGGEYRKSYHGYPGGFAQLVESPRQWVVEPMQIDTHNRNFGLTEETGYQPWFLPKIQQNKMTDRVSGLSPLIECPCSDRTTVTAVNVSGKVKHYWRYMNGSMHEWEGYNCAPEPRGDMLAHGDGTGRPGPNKACNAATYHGGLHCCYGGQFLTDVDQAKLIPDKTDVYFLKWRYYFQEYVAERKPSHAHLHHYVFLIDQAVNDYEESCENCGEKSVGKIEAHLKARDMGIEDVPKKWSTFTPLVMTPHCHAPSCIREELWNADTNEIICNVTVRYGNEAYGSLKSVFNEKDYVTIPPCLWGYQDGLKTPISIKPETNIRAVKYFNNTFRHLGQMAQWTGLLVYDHTPPFVFV